VPLHALHAAALHAAEAHLYAQDGCFSFQLACHRTT
jgi:hypothetical protein